MEGNQQMNPETMIKEDITNKRMEVFPDLITLKFYKLVYSVIY